MSVTEELFQDLANTNLTVDTSQNNISTNKATVDKISHSSPKFGIARPHVDGLGPSARGGHTVSVVNNKYIFIFGGHYVVKHNEYAFLNDIHLLDIERNKWKVLQTSGTKPIGRYYHSASVIGTRIVFFGGLGLKGPLRDLHAFDTGRKSWYHGPASGGCPSPRYGHTSVVCQGDLYIFGGTNGTDCFNDLYKLNLTSMSWSSVNVSPNSVIPSPRCFHSAVVYNNCKIFVFAGTKLRKNSDILEKLTLNNIGDIVKHSNFNDLFSLDVGTCTWFKIRTLGISPSPRYSACCAISDHYLICLGGWFGTNVMDTCVVLDLETNVWSGVDVGTSVPTRIYGIDGASISKHILYFGGFDGILPSNDLFVLKSLT